MDRGEFPAESAAHLNNPLLQDPQIFHILPLREKLLRALRRSLPLVKPDFKKIGVHLHQHLWADTLRILAACSASPHWALLQFGYWGDLLWRTIRREEGKGILVPNTIIWIWRYGLRVCLCELSSSLLGCFLNEACCNQIQIMSLETQNWELHGWTHGGKGKAQPSDQQELSNICQTWLILKPHH